MISEYKYGGVAQVGGVSAPPPIYQSEYTVDSLFTQIIILLLYYTHVINLK